MPKLDEITAERGESKAARQRSDMLRRLTGAGPVLALVFLLFVFTAINPGFATGANLRALLDQAALPLILVSGASLVIVLGCIDLSLEGAMAASGLTFVLLVANDVNTNDFGYAAVVAGVLAGGAVGLANGLIHTKLRIPSFMVTLGTWSIALGVGTVLFGAGTPQITDAATLSSLTGSVFGIPMSIVIAGVVVAVASVISRSTRLGRYAYAIGGDESVVRLGSVPIDRYKTGVFVLAGLCTGLAGVLGCARLGVGSVDVGTGQLFTTISAVVLGGTLLSGGRGGVLQSVVGVGLLTVLGNGLVLAGVSPYVQQAIQGVVIIIAVAATGWRARSRLRIVK
ncbi:ABC transporter permease [Saccharopolyspora sp. NPDC049426]|uniref:ABC transporter permease n=1 Tax=Saccharopolyspora sp. NPDC049426 TaxID=3155652 RepID=UPI003427D368